MELREIEILIDKYFDAETSIAEENQLKMYFSSHDVAPHLEQYRPMFGYFAHEKNQRFEKAIPLKTRKQYVTWLSVAASVVILFGVFTFIDRQPNDNDLGTFDDPEVALRETQKALNMLSQNVNKGASTIGYLEEYESSRKTIFKK
ncbi:hypothetical protein V1389_15345 [Flavobacterium rakeshii]|uniref:hypothetical protein n=1 Tax=Flavobacterium rakeshii TaxID=1038845 RepID=UPI002E7AF3BB|nr:hypothetical protein [Flavobacterium rakeshii]MEE1899721.1 hypothetical protein [Flavobacterium rakeshii]